MTVTITPPRRTDRSVRSTFPSSEQSASHDRQLNLAKSGFASIAGDRARIDTQPKTLTRVVWQFGCQCRAMRSSPSLVIYPSHIFRSQRGCSRDGLAFKPPVNLNTHFGRWLGGKKKGSGVE